MIDDPAANPTAEAEQIPEKRPVKFVNSKKRNKAEIELDKLVIAKLYLEQKTQLQIADWIKRNRPYNLSLPVISGILKALFLEWRAQAINKIDELKARDLAKLLDIERTASEAWERSLQTSEKTTHEHDEIPARITKKLKKFKPAKPILKVSVVKENRDGDPRFLEIILKCIAQRSEILGYKPNRKIDEGGEDAPIMLSVEVNNALSIAYGTKPTDQPDRQPARSMVEVRHSGGGDWSPEGPVHKLSAGATDIESEAT